MVQSSYWSNGKYGLHHRIGGRAIKSSQSLLGRDGEEENGETAPDPFSRRKPVQLLFQHLILAKISSRKTNRPYESGEVEVQLKYSPNCRRSGNVAFENCTTRKAWEEQKLWIRLNINNRNTIDCANRLKQSPFIWCHFYASAIQFINWASLYNNNNMYPV